MQFQVRAQQHTDHLNTPNTVDTTAQDEDLQKTKEQFSWKNNPKVATLLSTVLPGAGQFYNQSYWKIPIFWSVIGTFGFLCIDYHIRYTDYKEAFIYLTDTKGVSDLVTDPSETFRAAKYNEIYARRPEIRRFETIINPTDQERLLAFRRDDARRSRDYMIIFAVLSYVCNMVDAAVDAHFTKFDVSDNLSMKIEPHFNALNGFQPEAGMRMSITFNDLKIKQNRKLN